MPAVVTRGSINVFGERSVTIAGAIAFRPWLVLDHRVEVRRIEIRRPRESQHVQRRNTGYAIDSRAGQHVEIIAPSRSTQSVVIVEIALAARVPASLTIRSRELGLECHRTRIVHAMMKAGWPATGCSAAPGRCKRAATLPGDGAVEENSLLRPRLTWRRWIAGQCGGQP